MYILNDVTYINKTSLALGFFDGIHQGHKVVLKNTINIAKKNNTSSCVILFKKHPQFFFTGKDIDQILTFDEKLGILEKMGIDYVVPLNFENYHNITAQDYLENFLIKYFSPIAITTGFNHTFGYNKEGNSNFLRNNSVKYGYDYFEVPPFVMNEKIVSSSLIRNYLKLADFNEANKFLGYKFFIQGNVIHGEKLASKLGFASANINYPIDKINIPYGVYFVKVNVCNKDYLGLLNYGIIRDNLKTEVHILDFNKNIYNENIKISFITKIRNQIIFNNREEFKLQLQKDIAFIDIYKHFLDSKLNFSRNKFLM